MRNLNKDILTAVILAILLYIYLFFSLGFGKCGLDIPYVYSGGDDLTQAVTVKSIGENGWFWTNDHLGAPYGKEAFDFSANFLMNTENITSKVLYFFVKDAYTVVNIQFLLTFSFCCVTAFFVLRHLKINRPIAIFGSLLFGLAPYIFGRNVGHFCLSACYFVPLSILLCIWSFNEDKDYLTWQGFFKNKKNWMSILFAFLIANNGIGYYPFFTCFFLCVVVLCILLSPYKKIIEIKKPLKNIGLILTFFILAVSPAILYQILNGNNASIAVRNYAEGEIYGLKIVQLFMPLSGHNNAILNNLITFYNNNAPLVNENFTAYMGIGAIIGFFISILILICHSDDNAYFFTKKTLTSDNQLLTQQNRSNEYYILSRMILCAILFATIGGFSSIFQFFVQVMRGYNRISIFIQFMSVVVLCKTMNDFRNSEQFLQKKCKVVFYFMWVCLIPLCMWDQFPTWGENDIRLEANKQVYYNDKLFVNEIENNLKEGSMIFQLPYHDYPEAGPVNGMNDYELFAPYMHSSTLKWSYGTTKGREGALWMRKVAELPVEEMFSKLIEKGYCGIYINRKAYKTEELYQLEKELAVIAGEPLIDNNGTQSFFSLKSVNSTNLKNKPMTGILINNGASVIEGIMPDLWVWLENYAELDLYNYEDETIYGYELNFNLDVPMFSNLEDEYINIKINGEQFRYKTAPTVKISETVDLYPGHNVITIETNAKIFHADGDPRTLCLRMYKFSN